MRKLTLAASRLTATAILFFAFSHVEARILGVPEDYQTIQAGIDAAQDGDTVLLQPGVYQERLTVSSKTIVLGSLLLTTGLVEYIDSTILDGNDSGRVVRILGETIDSTLLRGFTIRRGLARSTYGGGIYCGGNQRPRIEDMIISDNRTEHQGGGMYAQEGTQVTLRRSIIRSNHARYGGGGAYLRCRMLTVEDCQITSNNSGNVSGLACTGIAMLNRVLVARNHGNSCSALLMNGNEVIINQLTVTANTNDTLFASNSAFFIEGDSTDHVRISNSIIYGNDFPQVGFRVDSLILSYCNIEGLEEGIRPNQQWCNYRISNSIDADPLFLDPDNGDFSLTADSPCIDVGDPESPLDSDGTRADIGAFYFHQRDIEVEPLEVTFQTPFGVRDSINVVIRNKGGTTLHVNSIELQNEMDFPFWWSIPQGHFAPAIEINPDSSLNVWFYFYPLAEDDLWFAEFIINSDDPDESDITIEATGEVLSVSDPQLSAFRFQLFPAFPNPFNSSTTIRFSTGSAARPTRLAIYDLSGRLVADLTNSAIRNPHSAFGSLVWYAEGLPGGIYLIRLESGLESRTIKTVLMK